MRHEHTHDQGQEPKITAEMKEWFEIRSQRHIDLVRENLVKMNGYQGLSLHELEHRGLIHDQSKYSSAEKEGYIWMTWSYRCRELGIEFPHHPKITSKIESANVHHRNQNLHHPEAHSQIDAMTTLDVVEMVCDWTAISQETGLGGGSAKGWALANLTQKWSFHPQVESLIFQTIDELDRRNLEDCSGGAA